MEYFKINDPTLRKKKQKLIKFITSSTKIIGK
jgi:hypothetical protein